GPVDLPVPPDDVVQLAVPGLAGQVFAVGVQVLAAGRLFAVLAVLGGRLAAVLAPLLPGDAQGEGGVAAGGEAVLIPAVAVVLHLHQGGKGVAPLAHLLHHAVHPVFHIVHVLFGHTELLHQIVHRLDVQLAGAVQAVALLLHLAVLHPLDEDNGRSFLASTTDHTIPPVYPTAPVPINGFS